MAFNFSANQYENAFVGKKLQNYTLPRKYKERPKPFDGYTQFVANNRGHLLENVPRSKESPWGSFMGTWYMPLNIPPVRPSYTARSKPASDRLKYFKDTSPLNNAVNGFKPFPCEKKPINTKNLVTPPPSFVRTPGRATQSEKSRRSRASSVKQQASRPASEDGQLMAPSPDRNGENPSRSEPTFPTHRNVKMISPTGHHSCPPSRLSANIPPSNPPSRLSKNGSPTKLIDEGRSVATTPHKMNGVGSRAGSVLDQGDVDIEEFQNEA